MKRNAKSRGGRQGFTLIELLVVVSIIALLVSILLPALSKARKQARRTVCAAQLKQYGVASFTYAANNNGLAPPLAISGYPYATWPNKMWNHCVLLRYMGFSGADIAKLQSPTLIPLNQESVTLVGAWDIFICPASNRQVAHVGRDSGGNGNVIMAEYVQYCGTDSGSYPGSNTRLAKMKPRSVLFADRIWASSSPQDCGGFHDSGDQTPGQVSGGSAARADGSGGYTADYPLNFFCITPSEFSFWIPKFD
jgi:prepilin-type N-terminal cleavage/methylation domain-containing protein